MNHHHQVLSDRTTITVVPASSASDGKRVRVELVQHFANSLNVAKGTLSLDEARELAAGITALVNEIDPPAPAPAVKS